MKQYAKLLLVLVPLFALFAYFNRHNGEWFFASVIPAIFVFAYLVIFASPISRNFIRSHPRFLQIGGGILAIGFIVGGVFLATDIPALAIGTANQIVMGMSAAGCMFGIAMVLLPRQIARYSDDVERIKSFAPPSVEFAGYEEGFGALSTVLSSPGMLVKNILPWAILTVAVPFAVLQITLYKQGKIQTPLQPFHGTPDLAILLLAYVLPLSFLLLAAVSMILLVWPRWVLQSRAPWGPFIFPGRSFWLLFWILLIANKVLNQLIGAVAASAKDIAASLSIADVAAVSHWLSNGIYILALLFFSPLALAIPPLAIGSKEIGFAQTGRMIHGNRMSFFVGLIAAVLPCFALRWILEALIVVPPEMTPGSVLWAILSQALLLVAIAALAVYLSRVYQKLAGATQSAAITAAL